MSPRSSTTSTSTLVPSALNVVSRRQRLSRPLRLCHAHTIVTAVEAEVRWASLMDSFGVADVLTSLCAEVECMGSAWTQGTIT